MEPQMLSRIWVQFGVPNSRAVLCSLPICLSFSNPLICLFETKSPFPDFEINEPVHKDKTFPQSIKPSTVRFSKNNGQLLLVYTSCYIQKLPVSCFRTFSYVYSACFLILPLCCPIKKLLAILYRFRCTNTLEKELFVPYIQGKYSPIVPQKKPQKTCLSKISL